jgi:hypothetical protein
VTSSVLEARDAALARGDALWQRLQRALDARPDRPLGPDTAWTGHDVYAHFARWQAHAAESIRCMLEGRPVPPVDGDENEVNERWRTEDRALSTDDVRARCLSTRDELRALLAGLDEAQWRRVERYLAAQDVTGEHYRHHLDVCAAELLA